MYTDKIIVFDLFGVVFTKGLASSIDHLQGVFNRPEEEISKVYRKWEKDFDLGNIDEDIFWQNINNELNTNINSEILSEIVITSYQIKKETVKLAKYLRRDFKIVAYSNYRLEWYKRLNKRHKVSKLFDKVFISSETKVRKPYPEAFDIVYNKYGISKQSSILIDDDKKNVNGFNLWGGFGIEFKNIYETEVLIRNRFQNDYPRYDEQYAGIFLQTKEGSLIFQRRDKRKGVANAGKLSVFGGRSEHNESIIDCAQRELREETNLNYQHKDFKLIGQYSCPIESNSWMHCTYYIIKNVNINQIKPNEGQGMEVWTPQKALRRKDLTEIPKIIIEKMVKENTAENTG